MTVPYIDIHCHVADHDVHNHHDHCGVAESEVFRLLSLRYGIDNQDMYIAHGGYFTAGVHPWDILRVEHSTREYLDYLSRMSPLAIGEIGLDFRPQMPDHELQIQLFEDQVKLAARLAKPVVVHSVSAQQATMQVMAQFSGRWIWHAFGRSTESARQILQHPGAYLSFGPALLQSPKLQQTLLEIPTSRLFLETDASLLDIRELYMLASQMLNISIPELKTIIANNFKTWSGHNVPSCC